jgi:hypothetical protein
MARMEGNEPNRVRDDRSGARSVPTSRPHHALSSKSPSETANPLERKGFAAPVLSAMAASVHHESGGVERPGTWIQPATRGRPQVTFASTAASPRTAGKEDGSAISCGRPRLRTPAQTPAPHLFGTLNRGGCQPDHLLGRCRVHEAKSGKPPPPVVKPHAR